MISLILPAYNEGASLQTTVEQARGSLQDVEHEIIVVDDGSTDQTCEVAEQLGVRLVRHVANMGYGAALKSGIRAAVNDTIVIVDADGTYPLEEIPHLLAEYNKGYNMVVGARTGAFFRESVVKYPMRLILKFLVEFTTGKSVPDVNSGFRVFSKQAILPYFEHLSNSFSFTTSLTLGYVMTYKFVSYVPIPYGKRTGTTRVRLLRDSLRTLQFIVQAILYYNPLKMFILMCAGIGLVSLLILVAAAIFHLLPALYVGVAGVLVAIAVFCLGLLAELLRQIMVK